MCVDMHRVIVFSEQYQLSRPAAIPLCVHVGVCAHACVCPVFIG
jgi:hypothetical protein